MPGEMHFYTEAKPGCSGRKLHLCKVKLQMHSLVQKNPTHATSWPVLTFNHTWVLISLTIETYLTFPLNFYKPYSTLLSHFEILSSISWRRKWQPTPVSLPGKFHWTKEPGRLQSMGLQRVGLDWETSLHFKGISSSRNVSCTWTICVW